MIKLSICVFLMAAFCAIPASAKRITTEFQKLNLQLNALPGARFFEGKINGIHIVGADIGSKNGIPFVLINGYGTSFPYLSLFVKKLTANGFRVFVYNPPGQGRGELSSGRQTDERHFGINGMLTAAQAVVTYAYKLSGRKKVILAGHSLGGMQARLATVSNAKSRSLRRRIAMIVPMMSPPLVDIENVVAAKRLHIQFLFVYLPALLGPYQWAQAKLTPIFALIENRGLIPYLVRNQNSPAWSGLFGAANLDIDNFCHTAQYVGPSHLRVSTQITKDFKRWCEFEIISTHDSLNLSKAWLRTQTSSNRIPTLYVLATRDSLVPLDLAKKEARLIGAQILTVKNGHLGAFFDRKATEQISRQILKSYLNLQSCPKLLKSH